MATTGSMGALAYVILNSWVSLVRVLLGGFQEAFTMCPLTEFLQ